MVKATQIHIAIILPRATRSWAAKAGVILLPDGNSSLPVLSTVHPPPNLAPAFPVRHTPYTSIRGVSLVRETPSCCATCHIPGVCCSAEISDWQRGPYQCTMSGAVTSAPFQAPQLGNRPSNSQRQYKRSYMACVSVGFLLLTLFAYRKPDSVPANKSQVRDLGGFVLVRQMFTRAARMRLHRREVYQEAQIQLC